MATDCTAFYTVWCRLWRWGNGGTETHAQLLAADGARRCAKGEDVPGHHCSVRSVLGAAVLCDTGASPRPRNPTRIRGTALCDLITTTVDSGEQP